MAYDTIYFSALKGEMQKVKLEVESNPASIHEKDVGNRQLLHWAALSRNTSLVMYLLNRGSQVDSEDDTQTTPLVLAASAHNYGTFNLLIARGANLNKRNHHGHSALQYACSKGWEEITILLLMKGADVNVADMRGATPLHRSASQGKTDIVQHLLKHPSIKVNSIDYYGNTPLHLACEEERTKEIKLLIEAGADIKALNKEGKTCWDLGSKSVKILLLTLLLNKVKALQCKLSEVLGPNI